MVANSNILVSVRIRVECRGVYSLRGSTGFLILELSILWHFFLEWFVLRTNLPLNISSPQPIESLWCKLIPSQNQNRKDFRWWIRDPSRVECWRKSWSGDTVPKFFLAISDLQHPHVRKYICQCAYPCSTVDVHVPVHVHVHVYVHVHVHFMLTLIPIASKVYWCTEPWPEHKHSQKSFDIRYSRLSDIGTVWHGKN